MSASFRISRRAFLSGLVLLGSGRTPAPAQSFAGLGRDVAGFAPVVSGRRLSFPADHGPHPDFRIEWWYVPANLVDAPGPAHVAQCTLFGKDMGPGAHTDGKANQQIMSGHAAVTR